MVQDFTSDDHSATIQRPSPVLLGCSHPRCRERGTVSRRTKRLRRSPATTAGWRGMAPGSAVAFLEHACDRPVYEPLTVLRGRGGTASCGSLRCLRVAARCAGVDSQTAVARWPTRAAVYAERHHPPSAFDTGRQTYAGLPTRTPDARSGRADP